MSTFKSNILKILRPPKKKIFDIHDPKGIKILFQLRVGLREHKRRHNFLDIPSDTCSCHNDAETTAHFLLHCNIYAAGRNSLNNIINPILDSKKVVLFEEGQRVNLLLYGYDTLSFNENKVVLSATYNIFTILNGFKQHAKRPHAPLPCPFFVYRKE